MKKFYPIRVTKITPETRDGLVITLEPAARDKERFAFHHGQYLTFRHMIEGEELRRSYSLCCERSAGVMQIAIKKIEGGAFSTWAHSQLRVGDCLESLPPMGNFTSPLQPAKARHYLLIGAGSGITPLLSIMKTLLAEEPLSSVTLIYANRQISTIMFREDLEDLKNRYLGRLAVIHIIKADTQDIDLFTGRLDRNKLTELFCHWVDIGSVNLAFICGPETLMLMAAQALRDHGLTDQQIKYELFTSGHPTTRPSQKSSPATLQAKAVGAKAVTQVSLTLDGTSHQFSMPRQPLGEGFSILEAALAQRLDVPYACKAGVCSTCRCKLLQGEVEMVTNHALEDYEVRAGYRLSCQSYPLGDSVVVSFDE